jgi:hypothetical protein
MSYLRIAVCSHLDFCKNHELLFEEFEKSKHIQDANHCLLQLYRSICREVARLEHQINNLKKRIDNYIHYRNKKIISIASAELGASFFDKYKVNIESIEFNNDHRIEMMESVLKQTIEDHKELINYHLHEFTDAVISKDISKAYGEAFIIDVKIPLCLSGIGIFNVLDNKRPVRVIAVLNVLPNENNTVIIISTRNDHSLYVQKYLSELKGPFDIINMIESWMIHGTDHWFIKPEVWKQIRPEFQIRILKDITSYDRNVAHPYDFTIFNSLKRHILENFSEYKISKVMPHAARKMRKVELHKLTD